MYTIWLIPRKHSKYATIKEMLYENREGKRNERNEGKSNSLNSTHKYEADPTREKEKNEKQVKHHGAREFQ